jgi:exodeoxyribonuclease V beta subunit
MSTVNGGQAGAFDLAGPLPHGLTVLEASAGTGKTYTIAALAARFVADGTPLDQLLLVTFTRAATGELRKRVRDRLVFTEGELGRVLAAGAPIAPADEVIAVLSTGPAELVEQRRRRLADAISHFDAVTIETTHGFCQRVLDSLGTLGEGDPDATFIASVDDLFAQVVDDLYVRGFYRRGDGLTLSLEQAHAIAQIAIENHAAAIHPLHPAPGSSDAMRAGLAIRAREDFTERKRDLALMTYDDQLTLLLAALDGSNGEDAVARLRDRYRVVLIDEFQDTDQTQWQIVERAFGAGGTTLVLIGDPKQAIYGFRGADVYSYLQAARSATQRRTLRVNYRSDQPLLDGLDALFGRARLGHEQIEYLRVSATADNQGSRLHGAPVAQALRLRVVAQDNPEVEVSAKARFPQAPSARAFIARDLAADVVSLLNSHAEIARIHDGRRVEASVAPGDIAVLVRSASQARQIQEQLGAVGVPAVIGGAGSVFGTAAARDWLVLLEALERPADPGRARAAALTALLGARAAQIATADEEYLEALHQRLYEWGHTLHERGLAALTHQIFTTGQVAARLLKELGGERHLTDLEQIAELLHSAASPEQLGITALNGWLRARIAAADRDRSNEELTRRLDSDADAVQVLTIHSSKGLEFPIVYCPFLWDGWHPDDSGDPVYFHDSATGSVRAIDVGLSGPDRRRHYEQHRAQERGEELRLAYVALTRARHQAVVWWVSSWDAKDSPLGRLLFAQDANGNVAVDGATRVRDDTALKRLREVAALAPSAIVVETASLLKLPSDWRPGLGSPGELSVAQFSWKLDGSWRRTSYSAITAAAHETLTEALVSSEPEDQGIADEPTGPAPDPPGPAPDHSVAPQGEAAELPLSAMASGPRLGTLIHRALEAIDFAEPDLEGSLGRWLAEHADSGSPLLGCPPEVAGVGLAAALATPLGGALGAMRLTDAPRADRLDELTFELPLAGGDAPLGRASLSRVAALLRERLPETDPLAGYAQRLTDPTLAGLLRGYLTGTIDLVLRTRDAEGAARYSVIDYKTNWLASAGEPLSAWHYRPQALATEMQRSHYALQALLYSVALHRYLRWRVRGYDPARELAGVHYLFLRGMVGPTAGGADPPSSGGPLAASQTGVFSWEPPAQLIVDLSELLDGR